MKIKKSNVRRKGIKFLTKEQLESNIPDDDEDEDDFIIPPVRKAPRIEKRTETVTTYFLTYKEIEIILLEHFKKPYKNQPQTELAIQIEEDDKVISEPEEGLWEIKVNKNTEGIEFEFKITEINKK